MVAHAGDLGNSRRCQKNRRKFSKFGFGGSAALNQPVHARAACGIFSYSSGFFLGRHFLLFSRRDNGLALPIWPQAPPLVGVPPRNSAISQERVLGCEFPVAPLTPCSRKHRTAPAGVTIGSAAASKLVFFPISGYRWRSARPRRPQPPAPGTATPHHDPRMPARPPSSGGRALPRRARVRRVHSTGQGRTTRRPAP